MDSDRWHTTPETDPRTCFETRIPRFARGEHHYRIVLRNRSYDAEKNGKIIGQFDELKPAQRCVEASAARARTVRSSRRLATLMKPK